MNNPSEKKFFEGKDFKWSPFKALMPIYYPLEYQEYINQEIKLLKEKIGWSDKVLEAGIGIGRLIPEIAPLVKEFIGIDNANRMVKESTKIAKDFSNVKIIHGNLEKLSNIFPKKYFDFSLCIWNTLGNVDDEVLILKNLWEITKKSIFITTYIKGTLENRKNWYKTIGIEIDNINEKNEIFYSKSGLKSKSFSLKDMEKLAFAWGLEIIDSKVLNGVMLRVEMKSLK